MVEQQVKMKVKDVSDNVLGFLFLKAMDRTQNKYENFKLVDKEFTNVARVEIPNNETPLQYLENIESENLSHLMLLVQIVSLHPS